MGLERIVSAIHNNVMSGLRGATVNLPFTLEQIEDGVVNERMAIIKEYALKNLIPYKDLTYSIRCIKVDCESLDRCPCSSDEVDKMKHFEIPQIFTEFGTSGVDFVGSTDGQIKYKVYIDNAYTTHKYKRRGAEKPYVFIDTTPNKNNMLDCFVFNAEATLEKLWVRILPKDIRQLDNFDCCVADVQNNITFVDNEIERRMTEKFLRWYRQMALPITPNDQTVKQ